MEMQEADLGRAAWALWPALAAQMGEDPGAWRAVPLARREDARVATVLLRLDGPDGRVLVLKHQRRPEEGFAEAMSAHLEAMEVYPQGVPALHALDIEARACAMDLAPGQPLSVMLEGAPPEAQAWLLRRAGAWLDGYHRATLGEARVFQPKFTLRYLDTVRGEVLEGAREIAQKERFLACIETIFSAAARYEGRQTMTARTHGDLHLRNLLLDRAGCLGIDFAAGRVVPVGHDIARLLADYAILHAPQERIARGEVLPDFARKAFFEGYTLVGPDDPSVGLLLRNRVLAEWWGLPARAEARSAAQARRFVQLMPLAERVFG
ncbi:phosphotransferase [Salipiger abyssi]|uniref:Phosphotransferase family protein n=1 Tax=Salipiger abyssi TaxID=1250539 RepID=A0A1P8UT39_9RHOB|nr:phosphotransferase [Salipiger abyssi]APZ52570.1 phosphotransferase family protein [Salipiger abyssi]